MREWFDMCICKIDVAILFLMLAFIMTTAIDCERDDTITIELSCWKWSLSFFPLLKRLKENWSEKESMILKPRESSR